MCNPIKHWRDLAHMCDGENWIQQFALFAMVQPYVTVVTGRYHHIYFRSIPCVESNPGPKNSIFALRDQRSQSSSSVYEVDDSLQKPPRLLVYHLIFHDNAV